MTGDDRIAAQLAARWLELVIAPELEQWHLAALALGWCWLRDRAAYVHRCYPGLRLFHPRDYCQRGRRLPVSYEDVLEGRVTR